MIFFPLYFIIMCKFCFQSGSFQFQVVTLPNVEKCAQIPTESRVYFLCAFKTVFRLLMFICICVGAVLKSRNVPAPVWSRYKMTQSCCRAAEYWDRYGLTAPISHTPRSHPPISPHLQPNDEEETCNMTKLNYSDNQGHY